MKRLRIMRKGVKIYLFFYLLMGDGWGGMDMYVWCTIHDLSSWHGELYSAIVLHAFLDYYKGSQGCGNYS